MQLTLSAHGGKSFVIHLDELDYMVVENVARRSGLSIQALLQQRFSGVIEEYRKVLEYEVRNRVDLLLAKATPEMLMKAELALIDESKKREDPKHV
jgi:hypothetical protein